MYTAYCATPRYLRYVTIVGLTLIWSYFIESQWKHAVSRMKMEVRILPIINDAAYYNSC